MIPEFINKEKIPHRPGVYIYKDNQGKILYVGKALDLYHRVASYFTGRHLKDGDIKTAALVEKISALETIVVRSELEALILEANLIKKYLPRYNIRLTDDKDYLYIKITKGDFPCIITARKKDLPGSLKYFGPFPSGKTVKSTVKSLRKVFPWCANPAGKRACFYYHINLCPGACIGKVSKKEYRKITNRFITFMEGNQKQLIDDLTILMNRESKAQNFEEASRIKGTIEGILYLTQPNKAGVYLENPNFIEDQCIAALDDLRDRLKLSAIPERIEGYDISNIQGKQATGSMVVLNRGEIDKSQYRKFKIQISGKPDDYAMHREVMKRRMKHFEWKKPDLLLIDGGKGQVSAVWAQIQESGSTDFRKIPVFGLAKRMEWLYTPKGEEIRLPRSSKGLHLLQRIRDEAHRFAITYHRKLHAATTLSI